MDTRRGRKLGDFQKNLPPRKLKMLPQISSSQTGMMTVHPSGFTHGPHPKAFNAATKTPAGGGRTETDEVAVMIDTRDAIDIANMSAGVEFEGYVKSWRPAEVKQAAE